MVEAFLSNGSMTSLSPGRVVGRRPTVYTRDNYSVLRRGVVSGEFSRKIRAIYKCRLWKVYGASDFTLLAHEVSTTNFYYVTHPRGCLKAK